MHSLLRLAVFIPVLALSARADIERNLTRTYTVADGDKVIVHVPRGSITVEVTPGDEVSLHVRQTVDVDSEAEADKLLAAFDFLTDYRDHTVNLTIRAPKSSGWLKSWRMRDNVKFKTELTVPAGVSLDLDTAGGKIIVNGAINGDLKADTSGGSISVTGGAGKVNLDTSGGSIRVARALGNVRADTSGGSIRIDYVGPNATDINADTSGGSITIGVDPAGNWDLDADTSGGRVSVDDLNLSSAKLERTSAKGRINAGGNRLRADTSGGSITIRAASPSDGES